MERRPVLAYGQQEKKWLEWFHFLHEQVEIYVDDFAPSHSFYPSFFGQNASVQREGAEVSRKKMKFTFQRHEGYGYILRSV